MFLKKKGQEIYLSLQISPSMADIKMRELYCVNVLGKRIHLNDRTRIVFHPLTKKGKIVEPVRTT